MLWSIVVRTHAHGTLAPPCTLVTFFYMQSPSFKQELAAVSTLGESAPVGVDVQQDIAPLVNASPRRPPTFHAGLPDTIPGPGAGPSIRRRWGRAFVYTYLPSARTVRRPSARAHAEEQLVRIDAQDAMPTPVIASPRRAAIVHAGCPDGIPAVIWAHRPGDADVAFIAAFK
ncbi:hypothetical protein HYPSUDRAFT_207934 [Hypholoma sublateritium FD-334 SS-4]|uniref:Uncharacterized protein n=1 Tax=Hypholoma sublateritium (strain FD-334 SS-4) TaxID=945553 RepID=A0A0D2LWY8_HYPSF|nr:hypothetical protein HYPSUDRAFT_207934 [Hypholoma sublateritium FD-334 SS-4]